MPLAAATFALTVSLATGLPAQPGKPSATFSATHCSLLAPRNSLLVPLPLAHDNSQMTIHAFPRITLHASTHIAHTTKTRRSQSQESARGVRPRAAHLPSLTGLSVSPAGEESFCSAVHLADHSPLTSPLAARTSLLVARSSHPPLCLCGSIFFSFPPLKGARPSQLASRPSPSCP